MSHGPPKVPIHLVPPLGGLLFTRGGHGKGLQPCFTIREDLTDRAGPPPTNNYMLGVAELVGLEWRPPLRALSARPGCQRSRAFKQP